MTAKSFSDVLGRQLRTSAGKADSRRKLIARVHVGAKAAGLSDDDRRALQEELTGKASLADMTLAEIGQVLDRLGKGKSRTMPHRPHVGKIVALWWTCYFVGAIDHPDDAALAAFVKRQTGADALKFVDHRAAISIIEALKKMAAREGVRWPTDADVKAIPADMPPTVDRAHLERVAVIAAIWTKLRDAGVVSMVMWEPYAERAIGNWQDKRFWTAQELDQVIRLLGKKLRRMLARTEDA